MKSYRILPHIMFLTILNFLGNVWAQLTTVFVLHKSFQPCVFNTLAYWAHLQVTKKIKCLNTATDVQNVCIFSVAPSVMYEN